MQRRSRKRFFAFTKQSHQFAPVAVHVGLRVPLTRPVKRILASTVFPFRAAPRHTRPTKLPSARSADAKKPAEAGFLTPVKPKAQNWFIVLSLPAAFSAASPLK